MDIVGAGVGVNTLDNLSPTEGRGRRRRIKRPPGRRATRDRLTIMGLP
jgi:hypothetical protein